MTNHTRRGTGISPHAVRQQLLARPAQPAQAITGDVVKSVAEPTPLMEESAPEGATARD